MTPSYYGRPVVKPHVWSAAVPLYYWIGGTAGSAAVQMVAARMTGNAELATVQKRVALAGALAAPVLLIVDLGVPKRFLHMLRVFKPTSPMSVGSWILSAFGAAIGASTFAELLGLRGASLAGEGLAATLGPGLATYTAVLLADTATPVWHDARRELPFVFVASGIAGAGAMGTLCASPRSALAARRLMIGGALATVAATRFMEHRLGEFIAEPYRRGRGGMLARSASACALAGALTGRAAGERRTVGFVAAALVIASGLLERYAIFDAGKQSASDPKYVIEPQRVRLDAARNGERAVAEPRESADGAELNRATSTFNSGSLRETSVVDLTK